MEFSEEGIDGHQRPHPDSGRNLFLTVRPHPDPGRSLFYTVDRRLRSQPSPARRYFQTEHLSGLDLYRLARSLDLGHGEMKRTFTGAVSMRDGYRSH